jgi:RNA polymerase sigma factor (sigma-70 family)
LAAVPSIGRASLLEPGAIAPEATATQDLYERHGARIHGYCLHQLGSREEAEDAVQTTFMNAFGALRKGVVPKSEISWLFKIAENVCLSRRRSSWRRGRIESPADFGVIEEVVAGPDTRHDELIGIEDALAAMPQQQRRAILLREWQGLSYREVAAELGVSQSAVETLIFRARRSLARGLTEPKPERRRLRKALHLGDLASVFIGAKALLGGTAAAHAAVAAVTVATVAGVTARPASEMVPDTVKAPPVPAVTKLAPAAPPAAPPARVVVEEPRQDDVSAAVRPAAPQPPVAKKPKARPTVVAPQREAPARAATPAAAGRAVAAERQADKARPAGPVAKPAYELKSKPAVGRSAKAPKRTPATEQPSQRVVPPAAAPSREKDPKPLRADEPRVSPPLKPAEKELPAAAEAGAATASEAVPAADAEHAPKQDKPRS